MALKYKPGRMMPINWLTLGGSSITANTATQGAHVPSHLGKNEPSKYWRTQNGVTSAVISGSFDGMRVVDCLALCMHNLSVTAKLKLTLTLLGNEVLSLEFDAHKPLYGFGSYPGFGAMGFGGYPAEDSIDTLWPYSDLWINERISADAYSLEISDPKNSEGFLRARYLMISNSWSPTVSGQYECPSNFDWGYSCGFVSDIEIYDRPDGATSSFSKPAKREMVAQWSQLNVGVDCTRINQILLWVTTNNVPIFWSGYPELDNAWGQQHVMLGKVTSWTSPKEIKNRGSFSIRMREVMFNG